MSRPVLAPKLTPAGLTVWELMPGDVALGQAGEQLKTLLGSCISVILTDSQRSVGAMCHIVHVGQPNASHAKNTAFGSVAMAQMAARLRAVGVHPERCHAYVYGGGNMFPQLFGGTHVGANNADWVFQYLHMQHIQVLDHCVGGNGYRKVAWTVGPTDPLVETVFAEQGPSRGN